MYQILLAFAIPSFLALIGIEYLVSIKMGKDYFKFNNSVTSLSIGIAERLLNIFLTSGSYFIFSYIYTHFALFNLEDGIISWVFLFLFVDFIWYWYHRFSHEINIFWAAHIVHHQSEDFNYTVSARITAFQTIIRTGFWCIIPLFGFPPQMITILLLIHAAYPFFIHTQLIGKLGFLEYFLVTPSHHRVHHASNENYLDKNYGDVLIIWDKLLGTFVEEKETPVFGLTKPLKTNSFLWLHFHSWLELGEALRDKKGVIAKIKLIFGKPGNISCEIRDRLEKRFGIENKKIPASKFYRSYIIFQISLSIAFLFLTILFSDQFSFVLSAGLVLFVLITLINCGAILEQREWVFYLEYIRFLVLFGVTFYYTSHPALLLVLFSLILTTLLYFLPMKRMYLSLVYGVD